MYGKGRKFVDTRYKPQGVKPINSARFNARPGMKKFAGLGKIKRKPGMKSGNPLKLKPLKKKGVQLSQKTAFQSLKIVDG